MTADNARFRPEIEPTAWADRFAILTNQLREGLYLGDDGLIHSKRADASRRNEPEICSNCGKTMQWVPKDDVPGWLCTKGCGAFRRAVQEAEVKP